MKKICILTTQRSGSTWVMDSIQKSVNSKGIFGELFLDRPAKNKNPWTQPHGNLVPPVRFFDWRKQTRAFFFTAPKLYLAFLELYTQKEKGSVFGFKVMHDQIIRKPYLALLLKKQHYSAIHLKRSNLLDVYISSQNMQKRKPHLRPDDPEVKKDYDPVAIDPMKAYNYIKRAILKEKIAKSIITLFGFRMETIYYDRLSGNDPSEIEKLNRFIGQSIDLFSERGLQKLSQKKTFEKIINYEDVIKYFKKKNLDKSYYI